MSARAEIDVEDIFEIALPGRPYPGLRPFDKCEWPIFFGRERMTDAIIARLIEGRFLVVHGDSGCGKSSLIRAGVLPRLEQEAARGGTRWLTCCTSPADDPVRNFAAALSSLRRRAEDPQPIDFRRAINCGRSGAAQLLRLLEAEHDHTCILFDQFEEIFAHARRHGPQQARLLIDLLIGIQQLASPRLCVILTMRSEFLGACAQFNGFAEAVNATQYLLPRMSHSDLVRAIREPASLYGGEVTGDLADHLIDEAGGGQDQLSLVQHGLMLLHRNCVLRDPARQDDHEQGRPWRLSRDSYRGDSGLHQLLSEHADEVMQKAVQLADQPEHAQHVVENLFRALTEINADGQATRCPQKLERLIAVTGTDEATLRLVIEQFRADGVSFLRPYGTHSLVLDDYIDISHEALIRCWRRIADARDGWLIREFKNGLIWRSLLVQAESFEASPANVLSAATTEERSVWLRARTPAWSERYGGGWSRVQQLMQASLAKLDNDKAQEQAERRQAEEARIREQRLQSELALTQERAQRLRMFRVAFALVLLLLLVSARSTFLAYDKSEAASRESQRLAAALRAAELRGKLSEEKSKSAQQTITRLSETTADLVRVAEQTTPVDSQVNQQIYQARNSLSVQVEKLRQVTQVTPSIYIHIVEEAQRAAAQDLQLRISNIQFGDGVIDVPGVELVKMPGGSSKTAVLRCFRPRDCERDGQRLLQLVNAQLKVPVVTLEDLSRPYASRAARIRERQFELWFGAGEIALQEQSGKAPKY